MLFHLKDYVPHYLQEPFLYVYKLYFLINFLIVCVCKCTYMHTQGTQEEVREFFQELIFSSSTFFEARSLLLLLLLLCILYASLLKKLLSDSLVSFSHLTIVWLTLQMHVTALSIYLILGITIRCSGLWGKYFYPLSHFPNLLIIFLPDNTASSANKDSLTLFI